VTNTFQNKSNQCYTAGMKIGIDIKSAIGKKTGKGIYAVNIVKEIISQSKEDIILYTPIYQDDSFVKELAVHKNVEIVQISSGGFPWHLEVFKDVLRRCRRGTLDTYFSPGSFIVTALLYWTARISFGKMKIPRHIKTNLFQWP